MFWKAAFADALLARCDWRHCWFRLRRREDRRSPRRAAKRLERRPIKTRSRRRHLRAKQADTAEPLVSEPPVRRPYGFQKWSRRPTPRHARSIVRRDEERVSVHGLSKTECSPGNQDSANVTTYKTGDGNGHGVPDRVRERSLHRAEDGHEERHRVQAGHHHLAQVRGSWPLRVP